MKSLIIRKLIVDERNELFDAQGMKSVEFPSDFRRVREYAAQVLKDCPDDFREGNLTRATAFGDNKERHQAREPG